MINAFTEALETWPENSPQRALAELDDIIVDKVLAEHLFVGLGEERFDFPEHHQANDDGEREWRCKKPNRAAAIALANRAQAFLLAGLPRRALSNAERATAADPSYVKAHHRVQRALEELGDKEGARRKAEEIHDYTVCRKFLPTENQALLTAGWIDWPAYSLVWSPGRTEAILTHLVEELEESERRIEVRVSLVPFQGGQGMMLSLVYGPTSSFKMGNILAAAFIMTDADNGEMADRPPNGHASQRTLTHAPPLIHNFIEKVERRGLSVKTVMVGQGLFDHHALVRERLVAEGHGAFVYQADSTAASEDAGIPPRHSEEGMRAKMILMGMEG
jgi:hypothetical protein